MAWLSGFNKRIKLTADSTKIDSDLSQFPLTVFLKSGNGDTTKVFDEVGSNKYKIAVTKSDGTTQLYVEIEEWDDTNNVGVLHCGLNGDTLSSSTNTDYYLYYDNTASDNTSYVGDTNSSVSQSVWDSNFVAIWHLTDLYDQTNNNNDLTNNGSLTTDTGKIANAYSFVGDKTKYLSINSNSSLKPNNYTISLWAKWTSTQVDRLILSKYSSVPCEYEIGFQNASPYVIFVRSDSSSTSYRAKDTDGQSTYTGSWTHITGLYNGSVLKIYINGTYKASSSSFTRSTTRTDQLNIGRRPYSGAEGPFTGLTDEVRISNTARSADWIKATYNSTNDSLLTYGTEESAPVTSNSLMFGMNF